MDHYYFETLPCHPQPERLESFTSYLTRLSQENGIRSASALSTLFFDNPKGLKYIEDYPLSSFGVMPNIASCPTQGLLSTTFYHLAKKFELSLLSVSLSRFLAGSIEKSLRYCPLCLAQYSYYFLPWRFLALSGCIEHACRFIDRCSHCGYAIPLLAFSLTIYTCPACKSDLRVCSNENLAEKELQIMMKRAAEIEFLLSPQPCEDAANTASLLRWRLAHLRQAKGTLVEGLSSHTNITLNEIRGIEYESTKGRGANFQTYIQYTDYLGVTLSELFNIILPEEEIIRRQEIQDRPFQNRSGKPLFSEKAMLRHVKKIIEDLKFSNQLVTQKSVAKMLHLSLRDLRAYPSVRNILVQFQVEGRLKKQVLLAEDDLSEHSLYDSCGEGSTERDIYELSKDRLLKAKVREDELVSCVKKIIGDLRVLEQPVTKRRISEAVPMTLRNLQKYPRVKALLDRAIETDLIRMREKHLQEEQELVKKVEMSIQKLEVAGIPTTQSAISKIMNVSLGRLKSYHLVRELLEQTCVLGRCDWTKYNKRREGYLVNLVEHAVKHLEMLNQPMSHEAIGRIVGCTPETLNRYPHVRGLLVQSTTMREHQRELQLQQREQELVKQVLASKRMLEASNQPVTQKNISKMIGISTSGLIHYSQVRVLLEQIVSENRNTSQALVKQREQELVEQVLTAERELRSLGQTVTQLAISSIVGQPPSRLKRSLPVRALLEQFPRGNHSSYRMRSKPTDDEVAMCVQEAIDQCEASDQIPSRRKLAEMAGISLGTLQYSFTKVAPLLKRFMEVQISSREKRVQEREDALVEKVLHAIKHLEVQRRTVTQKEIGMIVGMPSENLKHYPKIRAILAQIVEKNRKMRSSGAYLREYELIGRVLDAAVKLDLSGLSVTQKAISGLTGMSLPTLKRYPRVKVFIEKVVALRYSELERQKLKLEINS